MRKENTAFRSTHVKIVPYKCEIDENDKVKIKEVKHTYGQVIAGYNHSMAVTKTGHIFTWGYAGFGLLGRKGVDNIPV